MQRPGSRGLAALLLTLWLPALARAALAADLPAPLPEEEAQVLSLPAPDGERLYVTDVAFPHMVDGRVHVLDGHTGHYLGVIDSGYSALGVPSADGLHYYLATTYYDRLTHGNRTDVVEIHDARTLALEAEVVIPSKHAQAIPYRGMIAATADGNFLLVQNGTPASSVSVVDLRSRKFVGEIQTPGCWSVQPWPQAPRFSTLCGDGTLLTVTLDDTGQAASRTRSARFFDPDKDPLFIHPESNGSRRYFVSYLGDVYGIDLSGELPSFETAWPLLSASERKQGWRPGGFELTAVHHDSGTLFVAMHDRGHDGSHKDPAKEVWALDLATHHRSARIPARGTVSLAASQGAQARLYLLDIEKATITVHAIGKGFKSVGSFAGVGDTAMFMELR